MLGFSQKSALRWALRFWVGAFVPILANVLPVKEFCWETPSWYRKVRLGKVILLWLAVILIFAGVVAFLIAMWQVPSFNAADRLGPSLAPRLALLGQSTI
jgi:peptidoglycan biosynthesis protein MviN/MurJ (putative lipid II flippase)